MRDTLLHKSYLQYDKISRYSPFPYYYDNNDDKYVSGITNQLDDSTDFIYYRVKAGDTYDSIALKYYDNPTYYWIICDFNRILDSLSRPKVGELIKVPTFSQLRYKQWTIY